MKSKSQEKREAEQRTDKMVKPSKSVRDFNFPHHSVTIQATNIREAENKLEDHLKPKSKQDD